MNETTIRPAHVLVLGEPGCSDRSHPWADQRAHIERVDTFEEALNALRREPVDVIICRTNTPLPLTGVHVSHQGASNIETVGQGLCVVGKTGALQWANPKLLSLPENVRDCVCSRCAETFAWAEAESRAQAAHLRGRRFTLTTNENEQFEMTATPVLDPHNHVTQVAAVVWDMTDLARWRDQTEAIHDAGRRLLSIDTAEFSRADTQQRLSMLDQRVRHCMQDLLHFENFQIRVLDKHTNKLEAILSLGTPDRATEVELRAATEGNGICGYVAACGRSYVCLDTATDPHYLPGIEGGRSSLTVPLLLHDEVVGVANFESTRPAAFSEEDRQLAELFGRYIALALHLFTLLAADRQAAAAQLRSTVMAEVGGPLNDILADVETLIEDYIGHDDLRHRLRTIGESASRIRDTIRELTAGGTGLVGLRLARPYRKDSLLEGKRILMADDEEVLRQTVRDVLTGYGCVVTEAADGTAAIEAISKERFDLVISDIRMPHKDGYQVFAAAKDASPPAKVILTTGFGYDPNHTIIRARGEGLTQVLFKPFKVDQLLSEIRTALSGTAT